MKLPTQYYNLRNRGFTLIELLTVIAIIGIITAMVVSLAPAANSNRKRARVQAELRKLELIIDNYQSRLGHYPPDNAALTDRNVANTLGFKDPLTPQGYDQITQVNPLLYELTGGTNFVKIGGSPCFVAFNGTNLQMTGFTALYNLGGVLNAGSQMQVIYKPLPTPNAYGYYPGFLLPSASQRLTNFQGLLVPVEMPQTLDPANSGGRTPTLANFWHYDASSTNRHNPNSYDLWAEFVVGKGKNGEWIYVTNGNF